MHFTENTYFKENHDWVFRNFNVRVTIATGIDTFP